MSTVTSEVTHVVNAFADAWNRHDMEAFAQLFAADAEFVNVVGLWWKGRALLRGNVRQPERAVLKLKHARRYRNVSS